MSEGIERLRQRVRSVRSRALVRRWELGQLNLAAGAWYRLARRLTLSRRAWAISDEDADRLQRAGHHPDPVGNELDPPRRLFVVREEHLSGLGEAREVALRSSSELLAHRNLALVPFDERPAPHQDKPAGH